MAEPIGPEAYLAIATSVQNAVNNYRDKKHVEQNHKLAIISADSSKSSLALPADELLSCSGLKIGNDGYVQWALDSPAHPRNWSRGRKAYDAGLILFLEFLMSVISAAGTPASFYGLGGLGQRREVGLVGFTTMYLLGQALGVLLLSPYSDSFGRRTLYIASAFLYSVFCLPVAATSNIAGVFVGRFITGVISAIPALTTRRSIEDLFGAEGRMWAFFCWALVTNLALVLGPVYASYVAVSLNWRWPFYLATIIVAVTGMLMYFVRESHTSQLLERKVAAIQSHRADLILRTAPTTPRPSIFQPVILFFTKPIVFLSSLTNAFSTALLYLFAVAFPLIYAHYAWNRQKTTLIFLFIALGLSLSTLTRFHDRHAIRKSHLTNRGLAPEHLLLGLAIGAPVLAIALWCFAWTLPTVHPKAVAWPASAVSLIPLGYAVNEHSAVLPRYILDCHKSKTDAASAAFTAMLFTRALLSAVFPLFTQQIFENLGANSAGSILAAIATAFCFLCVILVKCGARLRGGSGASVGGVDGGDEAGQGMDVERKARPKKTVRWGDEADSGTEDGASEMKSENPISEGESASGSSEISRTETETETESEKSESSGSELPGLSRLETRIDTEISAEGETKEENQDTKEDEVSELSRVHTKKRESGSEGSEGAEIARVETESSSSSSSADRENEKKKKKKKKKVKKVKKEMSRVDDRDNGAAGFWGMDFERLAVLPYF